MSAMSDTNIARAMYLSLADKAGVQTHEVHKKIIHFLARKRLRGRTSGILLQLQKIINSKHGIVSAVIHSAHKLKEETEKELVHFLKKRYSAKEVVLTKNLDEKLLGGMRIEVNDEVIDLSIKNKMKKLQEYLTRSHE